MPERIEFETPENVRVSYQLAGLGSRFIAWLIDSIVVLVILFLLGILLLVAAIASGKAFEDFFRSLEKTQPGQPPEIPMYFLGILVLLWGFGSFAYFGLYEYCRRGQTLGKRQLALRVAKADGFALDATSIFLRNIFRVVDSLPPLWLVPLFSAKSQRLGDMVGGTVVVKEETVQWDGAVDDALARPAGEPLFRFEPSTLARATPADVEAVRRILERWGGLGAPERVQLLAMVCKPLAERLQTTPPDPARRERFLRDFLAAYYRQQRRQLG